MNKHELLSKINEAPNNRYITSEGLEFYLDQDTVIFCETRIDGQRYMAFIIKSEENLSRFYLSDTGHLNTLPNLVKFCELLAAEVSYQIEGFGVTERVVDKEVDHHREERFKDKGKIEVYEALLHHRPINLL